MLIPGMYILQLWLNPDLQKVNLVLTDVVFLMHNTGSRAHDLNTARLDDGFIAKVVDMIHLSFKQHRDDFHIYMRMDSKTFPYFHIIIIKGNQCPKSAFGGIVVITEAETKIAFKPANVFCSSFVC